jgi:alpha-D-ribose 1-methylphosphonate 5-triphosphate synthase subunit PhnH
MSTSMCPRITAPDTRTEELLVTQRAFREVMDALARPGQLRSVPPMPRSTLANPWLETLTQMLLDSSCTFCAAASDEAALAASLATRSSAVQVPVAQAHVAVITADASEASSTQVLCALSGGTDESPERGATAIIECAALGALTAPPKDGGNARAAQASWFCVTGPGVSGEHSFCATQPWWYEARESRGDEFPCGIDVLLIDQSGSVVGLPRTAQLRKHHAGAPATEQSFPRANTPAGEGD